MPPSSRRKPSSRPRERDDDHAEIPDDPVHFQEAIDAFEKRVPLLEDELASLLEEEKGFAFTVADVAQADIVSDVYEAVGEAIKDGSTLEDFKAKVSADLEEAWGGEDPGRLDTIFRTNVLTSYNEGRHAVFSDPDVKRLRPYWRWEAIDDDHIDDECAPFLELVLPADDPFWSTHIPPLHFNCRCTYTALDEEEAAEEGITDEPPDVDADDGFGSAPSSSWRPDPDEYAAAIGDALRDRLAKR